MLLCMDEVLVWFQCISYAYQLGTHADENNIVASHSNVQSVTHPNVC